MTTRNGTVSNRILDALEANRRETKGDILRVEAKVDGLRDGIITNLQNDISSLKTREATLNTKVVALVFIVSTTSSALIYVLLQKLLGAAVK